MSLARALPFVSRALPTILSGVATGLLSGGINKAISGGAAGDGLYLHKMINAIEYRKFGSVG